MAKVQISNNLTQIITDIPADYVDDLRPAKDEEGNEVFMVTNGSKPSVTAFGVVCNTVVDGKLAVAWFSDTPNTPEDFKTKKWIEFFKKLKKYTPEMMADVEGQRAEAEDALNGLFD